MSEGALVSLLKQNALMEPLAAMVQGNYHAPEIAGLSGGCIVCGNCIFRAFAS
jgi:hypothetical protein